MNRRGFLKSVVGASAALVTPALYVPINVHVPGAAILPMATEPVAPALFDSLSFAAAVRPGFERVFDGAYENLPDA